MENFKIDFSKKTITISKEFEKKLNEIESEEYDLIKRVSKDFPQIRIVRKTIRKSKVKSNPKGLTYAFMERYISFHDNSDELFRNYLAVKTLYNNYCHVRAWFVAQFPDYNEIPNFVNGKLHANIIDIKEIIKTDEENSKFAKEDKSVETDETIITERAG